MKYNKETMKSALRAIIGMLCGAIIILADLPEYAPLAAVLPFLMRFADPSDPSIGIGKKFGKGE